MGGCVRDSLLNKIPHDWDITTDALPDQIIECFNGYKIIPTGLKHGTVTLMIDGEAFEITTHRVDGEYSDNRRPDNVSFTRSLKEDLSRRDFRMNAVAYNTEFGIIDYFNGVEDIKRGLVRCVGDPDDRFQEDALRMLRALRFASVYDFEIAESVCMSIHYNKELLKNIASERINVELCKLLTGVAPEQILKEYTDVLSVFIPELSKMVGFNQHNPHHIFDVWNHTIKSIVAAPNDVILRLTMLLHDIGKPLCFSQDEQGVGHFYGHAQHSVDMADEILKRLKFDNNTIDTVKELVLYHDAEVQPRSKSIRRWLNKIGEQRLRQLVQIKMADVSAQSDLDRVKRLSDLSNVKLCIDEVIEQQQCFSLRDLAVNGTDLMTLGVTKGIQIGKTLNYLMDQVIDEVVDNNKESLLALAGELNNIE